MKRIGLILAASVFHQFHPDSAQACGAIPYLLTPLLPLEDAVAVGVDAALIASVNMGGAVDFELRKADALAEEGAEDAGSGGVALDVTCDIAEGSKVCIAKPTERLEPNTSYVWRLRSEGYVAKTSWRAFTTTDVANFVGETKVEAQVVSEERTENICGNYHLVNLEAQVGTLPGPTVLHVPGGAHNLFEPPIVLTEGNMKTTLQLWWPPACFELALIDATGASTRVAQLCTPSSQLDGGAEESERTDRRDADAGAASVLGETTDAERDEGGSSSKDEGGARAISEKRSGCTLAATPATEPVGTLGWVAGLSITLGAVWRRRVVRRK